MGWMGLHDGLVIELSPPLCPLAPCDSPQGAAPYLDRPVGSVPRNGPWWVRASKRVGAERIVGADQSTLSEAAVRADANMEPIPTTEVGMGGFATTAKLRPGPGRLHPRWCWLSSSSQTTSSVLAASLLVCLATRPLFTASGATRRRTSCQQLGRHRRRRGGPTDDKPTATLETPPDPDRVSSCLNIGGDGHPSLYAEWSAVGANPSRRRRSTTPRCAATSAIPTDSASKWARRPSPEVGVHRFLIGRPSRGSRSTAEHGSPGLPWRCDPRLVPGRQRPIRSASLPQGSPVPRARRPLCISDLGPSVHVFGVVRRCR